MYLKLPMLSLTMGFVATAAGLVSCKPTEESAPAPKPVPSPVYTYPAAVPTVFTQPTVSTTQPKCDPAAFECSPDPKIVELCKAEQQDDSKCDPQIEKTLYETLKAKVLAGGNTAVPATCRATVYVNTQVDPSIFVRSTASVGGAALGSVDRGSSLCVTAQTGASDGTWYQVNFGGKLGYVRADLTSPTKPGATGGTGGTKTPPPSCGQTFNDKQCFANQTFLLNVKVRCVSEANSDTDVLTFGGDEKLPPIDRGLCVYPGKTERYMRARLSSILTCYVLERDVHGCN